MGLFSRTPRQLKDLDAEIVSARIALSMSGSLEPAHREHVMQTAPREVAGAAAAAASAGYGTEARAMLDDARNKPPGSGPDASDAWSAVVDRAITALG